MKESSLSPLNIKVEVVNARPMTEQEERRFETAIDALLIQWIQRQMSRQSRGIDHVQSDQYPRNECNRAAPQQ